MPKVFLSYSHIDNDDRKWVEWLKDHLEAELRRRTGSKLWEVFLDSDGIGGGQKWRKLVGDEVAASAFFVCLTSPSYFNSQICRDELGDFVRREASLFRDDLIIPFKVFAPGPEQANDPFVQLCLDHHYIDFDDVRLMEFANVSWRQKVGELARAIVEAHYRGTPLTVESLTAFVAARDLVAFEQDAIDAGAFKVTAFSGDDSRYRGPFEALTCQAQAAGIVRREDFAALLPVLENLVPRAVGNIVTTGHRIAAVAEDLLTVALGLHSSMNGRPSIRWHDLFTPDLAVSLTKVCREAAPAQARRQP